MSRISRANGHTRNEILTTIKCNGSMTAEELGRELTISPVAVRQHLSSLEAEDIVTVDVERRGLGRPAHRYRLTAHGDETFTRCYDTLAGRLLDELIRWQGEDAVTSLLARHREQTAAQLRNRIKDKLLPVKVRELARFQTEQGFMAEVSDDGSGAVRLIKHNCAVRAVALQHPGVCCEGDLPMLKEVLGDVDIVQETNILHGCHSCTFRIRDCRQEPAE